VRLAVRQPPANRGADARRHLRVQHVHVEAEVDEAIARDVLQRLAHRRLDTHPVNVAHREDKRLELREQVPLAGVERSDAHQRDALRLDSGECVGLALELSPGEGEGGRERHPVDVPARRGLRAVEVAVRIEPEHAARARGPREPAQSSERDGMVASEHEREGAVSHRVIDQLGDPLARRLDLRQVAHALVDERGCLRDGGDDVAPVLAGPAQLGDALV
jgi:hypothetical protein